jgi:hypothetical protein
MSHYIIMSCQYRQKHGNIKACDQKAVKDSIYCSNHKRRIKNPDNVTTNDEKQKKTTLIKKKNLSIIETDASDIGDMADVTDMAPSIDTTDMTDFEKEIVKYIDDCIDDKIKILKRDITPKPKTTIDRIIEILGNSILPVIITKLCDNITFDTTCITAPKNQYNASSDQSANGIPPPRCENNGDERETTRTGGTQTTETVQSTDATAYAVKTYEISPIY